jgi:hypothetical protein
MAAKHFMVYYQRGTGTFIVTEPRPWAKENRHVFPVYNFINQIPTTNSVERRLIEDYGFRKVIENEEIVLVQSLNTNLEF